jgi:hypothetical protein
MASMLLQAARPIAASVQDRISVFNRERATFDPAQMHAVAL